jgi:hypothetical protein
MTEIGQMTANDLLSHEVVCLEETVLDPKDSFCPNCQLTHQHPWVQLRAPVFLLLNVRDAC